MQRERLRDFPVICAGTKKRTVKIQKRKYEISYLSKKEYKEKLEETDHGTELLGYTTLKQSSIKKNADKDDRIIGLLALDHLPLSAVERSRKRFRTVKGYVYAGNNRYIAVEKCNPLFLLLFLFLGLLCILTALGLFREKDSPAVPWFPTLEEIIDTDDEEKNEIPNIQVAGFSAWHIPAGQTENISVFLSNPKGNPCYFSFDITLKDSGEVIYTSNMVQPGDAIRKINLSKPLEVGKYTAVVHIRTNELETGNEMNSSSFEVELTVS